MRRPVPTHHPDAARAAMTSPRDAMPVNEAEAAVTALLLETPIQERDLAEQLDRPLDEVHAALLRAAVRGTAIRVGTTWRRAR